MDNKSIRENAGKIALFDAADTYLNLGSIVSLKKKNTSFMIIGRWYNASDGTRYDYLGVQYPMGFISPNFTALFNKADIEEVLIEAEETLESRAYTSFLTEYRKVVKGESSKMFEEINDLKKQINTNS